MRPEDPVKPDKRTAAWAHQCGQAAHELRWRHEPVRLGRAERLAQPIGDHCVLREAQPLEVYAIAEQAVTVLRLDDQTSFAGVSGRAEPRLDEGVRPNQGVLRATAKGSEAGGTEPRRSPNRAVELVPIDQ
jgi:hypothetical protein